MSIAQKFPLRWLAAPILLLSLSLWAGDVAMPGLDDIPLIAADVNGTPIYRHDLVRELVGSCGADALDRLVRRTLVEQEAQKLKITVTPDDIERQLILDKRDLHAELIKAFPDVNKEFPLADLIYARFRMTVDEYKNLVVRHRLLTRRCLGKDLAYTDATLQQFFEQHQELFQPPVLYHASHILISPLDPRDLYKGLRCRRPISQMAALDAERKRRINLYRDHGINLEGGLDDRDPAWLKFKQAHPELQLGAPPVDELDPAWKKTRQAAEKVLADIRAGVISWDQAVRKYTQDSADHVKAWPDGHRVSEREKLRLPPGDVGLFHSRGPVVKEFYEGAKNLKAGEIGGPVKTEFGWHLIRMIEVTRPNPVTFAQCKDEVERLYVEREILDRSEKWLARLLDDANLQAHRTLLWPPLNGSRAAVIPAPDAKPEQPADADPIIGTINGTALRRSEVWRELLRSDGDEALTRLIHSEIVLTMLKTLGLERLEWESSAPSRRTPQPPQARPVAVNPEAVELEINTDRLRKDREAPDVPFKDYIYLTYGQSVEDYKRKINASLILREAIRRRVPVDEGTLRLQFALARELYSEPPWYEVSHILIKPTGGMDKADDSARLQARLVADQVYKDCVASPDKFPQFVQDYSMDTAANKAGQGRLGQCYPDVRSPDFLEAPQLYTEIRKQNLQRGQISTPIRSARGWHILHIDGVHAEMRAEFDQAKARVERDYLQERAKMYTDLWLRALTAQAKVKRFLFQRSGAPVIEDLPPDTFKVPKDQ